MAKFAENFRDFQDECKITIIRNNEVLTMTTKQYKALRRREKMRAARAAQQAQEQPSKAA